MRTLERISPTRMNLLRAMKRLDRTRKGIVLLRRKREALVSEFFRRARPAAEARRLIGEQARRSYPALLRTLALHAESGARALGWPSREVVVSLRPSQVWGIPVSEIVELPPIGRSLDDRGTAPGSTGLAAAEAAAEFEKLVSLILSSAPEEMVLRRLGDELARTSRQVNMLEQRLAPAMREQVATIRRVLDERERDEHLRSTFLSERMGRATPRRGREWK
ncbi:MAG TPA: V-type ATP synthase subunit D [Vicinamibacteria bacterium]|nr:V-type ATP synthase subunit D [Vicinamibacteria bacterium]